MKLSLLLLVLPALLFAQTTPDVDITAEPHHHLVFANAQVRVFSVEVPPHTATLMHRHLHDYIYVTLGAADISNEVSGQPATELKLADGETRFSPGPFAHLVRDLAEQPFRNVTVELLQDDKIRHSTPHWKEDRGLEILPGGTEEILFVKDGVRASEFELQPGGTAPMPAGAFLLVAVSDLRLHGANLPRNAPRNAWEDVYQKPGYSYWFPAGALHALINTGKQPAKFVTLELP
jgi:quercetin dioxygenase-like cupin family protein